MKLFVSYKKFQRVLEELEEKHNKENINSTNYIQELLFKNDKLEHENRKLEDENIKYITDNSNFELKNNELKIKVRELNGAKGGLTKQINKLQEKLTEAEIKLSQRFILKEVAAKGRPRKTQTMGIKSGTKTSKIIKKVKENNNG